MNQKKIYIVNYPIKSLMTKKQFDNWVENEVERMFLKDLDSNNSANHLIAILRSFTNVSNIISIKFSISATSKEELDTFSRVLGMISNRIKNGGYTTGDFSFVPVYTSKSFSTAASVSQRYNIDVTVGRVWDLSELLNDVKKELEEGVSRDDIRVKFLKTAQYETRILTLDETEE